MRETCGAHYILKDLSWHCLASHPGEISILLIIKCGWNHIHPLIPWSDGTSFLLTPSPLNQTLSPWEWQKWSPTGEVLDYTPYYTPCQYHRKCIENSVENMQNDLRFKLFLLVCDSVTKLLLIIYPHNSPLRLDSPPLLFFWIRYCCCIPEWGRYWGVTEKPFAQVWSLQIWYFSDK